MNRKCVFMGIRLSMHISVCMYVCVCVGFGPVWGKCNSNVCAYFLAKAHVLADITNSIKVADASLLIPSWSLVSVFVVLLQANGWSVRQRRLTSETATTGHWEATIFSPLIEGRIKRTPFVIFHFYPETLFLLICLWFLIFVIFFFFCFLYNKCLSFYLSS